MRGYIKYFNNGGKNMSFKIEDDSALVKYNDIWNKIKTIQSMKLNSKPVYDEKYINAKIKTFNGVVNKIFRYDKSPKENVHYTCIAAISIDSTRR